MSAAASAAAGHSAAGPRKSLLARVHIARKELAIAEDDYRAIVERVTGHASAGDCTAEQLGALVAHFERLGFKPAGRARRRDIGASLVARKARAMWISLSQLGAIDDSSDAALESFGKRQLGVDRLRWANEREGYRLIEALKGIAQRHGWDQRVPAALSGSARIRLLKDRLVGAQLARLETAGAAIDARFTSERSSWSERDLEAAAAELGRAIRRAAALQGVRRD